MQRILTKAAEKMGVRKARDPHDLHVHVRPHHDVFFIWSVLMFIAVIGAHFVLNVTPGSPTGYVTAAQSPTENLSFLLDGIFILFMTVLVVAMAHETITSRDY